MSEKVEKSRKFHLAWYGLGFSLEYIAIFENEKILKNLKKMAGKFNIQVWKYSEEDTKRKTFLLIFMF